MHPKSFLKLPKSETFECHERLSIHRKVKSPIYDQREPKTNIQVHQWLTLSEGKIKIQVYIHHDITILSD